jgi:hypothetical protein
VEDMKRAEEELSFLGFGRSKAEELKAIRKPGHPLVFIPSACLRPSKKSRAFSFSSLHVLHAFM